MNRLRRRVRFAAPLVMVVACGQAPPAAIPVEAPAGMEPAVAAVPVDAAPADAPPEPEPVDAAAAQEVADAAHVVLILPERTVQPSGFVSCHDFGPGSRGCNPPRPVHHPAERRQVPIIDLARTGVGYVISVDLGDPDLFERDAGLVVRAPLRRGRAPKARVRDLKGDVVRIELTMSKDEINAGLELEVTGRGLTRWEPLPPPVPTGRIVSVESDGPATIVTFALGARDGVIKGMRGHVVDRDGKVLLGGAFTVAIVLSRHSVAKVKLTEEPVRDAGHIRLGPPEP